MNILLLDGYNLMYRARYGFSQGPHAAVYTFFRSLRPLIEKFDPDRVYFVLEGYPQQRMDLLPEYKATRVFDDKDDFIRQKKFIIELMKSSFPIHVVRHPHHECDDVIGNLVKYTHKDDDCVVVSTDTDFIQLLNSCQNVRLYNPVKKDFVSGPEYDYVVWKSLRGDGSDNISGFKGIGDKRAVSMASNAEVLEDFLDRDGNRKLFEKNCTLIRFFDLKDQMQMLELYPPVTNWDKVRAEFSEMGFYSITNDTAWKKYVETFQRLT